MSANEPVGDSDFYVTIRPEAEAEIQEAYQWYERALLIDI